MQFSTDQSRRDELGLSLQELCCGAATLVAEAGKLRDQSFSASATSSAEDVVVSRTRSALECVRGLLGIHSADGEAIEAKQRAFFEALATTSQTGETGDCDSPLAQQLAGATTCGATTGEGDRGSSGGRAEARVAKQENNVEKSTASASAGGEMDKGGGKASGASPVARDEISREQRKYGRLRPNPGSGLFGQSKGAVPMRPQDHWVVDNFRVSHQTATGCRIDSVTRNFDEFQDMNAAVDGTAESSVGAAADIDAHLASLGLDSSPSSTVSSRASPAARTALTSTKLPLQLPQHQSEAGATASAPGGSQAQQQHPHLSEIQQLSRAVHWPSLDTVSSELERFERGEYNFKPQRMQTFFRPLPRNNRDAPNAQKSMAKLDGYFTLPNTNANGSTSTTCGDSTSTSATGGTSASAGTSSKRNMLDMQHETPAPLKWVRDGKELDEMVAELILEDFVAIDIEHHSKLSFTGFCCLLQISSKHSDWIVDLLATNETDFRSAVERLNKITANPNIVKVLHGADHDVIWLQRDFGVYVINLCDTGQLTRVLKYPGGFGLANLYKNELNFLPDKSLQLADWRERPLSDNLVSYARSDTHFLLYVWLKLMRQLYDADGVLGAASGGASTSTTLSCFKSLGPQHPSSAAALPKLDAGFAQSQVVAATVHKPEEPFPLPRAAVKLLASKMSGKNSGGSYWNVTQFARLENLLEWRNCVARILDVCEYQVLPPHVCCALAKLPLMVAPAETSTVEGTNGNKQKRPAMKRDKNTEYFAEDATDEHILWMFRETLVTKGLNKTSELQEWVKKAVVAETQTLFAVWKLGAVENRDERGNMLRELLVEKYLEEVLAEEVADDSAKGRCVPLGEAATASSTETDAPPKAKTKDDEVGVVTPGREASAEKQGIEEAQRRESGATSEKADAIAALRCDNGVARRKRPSGIFWLDSATSVPVPKKLKHTTEDETLLRTTSSSLVSEFFSAIAAQRRPQLGALTVHIVDDEQDSDEDAASTDSKAGGNFADRSDRIGERIAALKVGTGGASVTASRSANHDDEHQVIVVTSAPANNKPAESKDSGAIDRFLLQQAPKPNTASSSSAVEKEGAGGEQEHDCSASTLLLRGGNGSAASRTKTRRGKKRPFNGGGGDAGSVDATMASGGAVVETKVKVHNAHGGAKKGNEIKDSAAGAPESLFSFGTLGFGATSAGDGGSGEKAAEGGKASKKKKTKSQHFHAGSGARSFQPDRLLTAKRSDKGGKKGGSKGKGKQIEENLFRQKNR